MQFDRAPPGVFSSRTTLGFTGGFLSSSLRPHHVSRDAVLKARNVTELETIFVFCLLLYLSCCAHHYLDSWLIILVLNLYLHGLVLKDKDKALSSSADSHYS